MKLSKLQALGAARYRAARQIFGAAPAADHDKHRFLAALAHEVWSRLRRLKLGDHVDFDASAKWQLCHTDGAARMDAPLAEHLNKEFRRPIRNSVRFREVRCAVDHDKELYDSSNAAKIADGSFKHGQQFNCHVARGELALIKANLLAHFAAEELTALLAKAAREMNLVTGTSERRERRHISVDDWRHDVG
jgi:hypothetical protein